MHVKCACNDPESGFQESLARSEDAIRDRLAPRIVSGLRPSGATICRRRTGSGFQESLAQSEDAIRDRLAPRSPSSSVASAALAVGARVEIHSLLAAARAPELNGVHGEIVVPLDSSTGRCGVKTDTDGRVWSLRPDNLRRLEAHGHASPASPGRMRIACTAYAARSPDELR